MTQLNKNSYKFKLLYFEDRGSADLIKLLFAYANQPYDDVQIKPSDWNTYKVFLPFEQLPCLILNDETHITTTNAICRFLANYLHLNGSNEIENSKCDMVNEQLKECADHAMRTLLEADNLRKQQMSFKFINEILPKSLLNFF